MHLFLEHQALHSHAGVCGGSQQALALSVHCFVSEMFCNEWKDTTNSVSIKRSAFRVDEA